MTSRDQPPGSGAADTAGAPQGGSGLTKWQTIAAVATAITAIAVAIGAVSGLFAGGHGTPVAPTSELRVIRFERNITHAMFATRYPQYAPQSLTPKDGTRLGGVLHLDLKFNHFDKQRCSLSWTMIDAANDKPVQGDADAGDFELEQPFEHFAPAVWIPAPSGPEHVYVALALASDDGPCGEEFRSKVIGVAG